MINTIVKVKLNLQAKHNSHFTVSRKRRKVFDDINDIIIPSEIIIMKNFQLKNKKQNTHFAKLRKII